MNEQNFPVLILIVEDDRELARLNARFLKRNGYEVIVAYNAAEARSLFYERNPNLFVLDIGLPDGDGLLLCEEFRKETNAPVLFLTGKTETGDKITGLRKGGDYYLTKPYDSNELLAVVQSLIRREEQTQKKISEVSVIRRGVLTLNIHERKVFVNERDAELTPKEFSVLLILVQNEDKELTYETIYENVWGTAMNNDSSALRQQISRLKKKLDEENTDSFAILNDHGKGYTFTTT